MPAQASVPASCPCRCGRALGPGAGLGLVGDAPSSLAPIGKPRCIPVERATDQLFVGWKGTGVFFVSLGKMRSSPSSP